MFAVERQKFIVNKTRDQGRVDVATLAELLDVTTETIRRDLSILERQGLVYRVHGGAVPVEDVSEVPGLRERTELMAPEKRAIARHAVAHLPLNGSVLLDAGTTVAQLAAVFPTDRHLTIFSNALVTSEQLAHQASSAVYMIGGIIRPETLASVDTWALERLQSLEVDIAFIGAYGVSEHRGFSTPNPSETAVKRAMVKTARKKIVLADHSKLGQSHLTVFASLHEIDLLITDSNAPRKKIAELRNAGLNIELATVGSKKSARTPRQTLADGE